MGAGTTCATTACAMLFCCIAASCATTRCAATIASGMLRYKARMPNAAFMSRFSAAGCRKTIFPAARCLHPSHLRRTAVTTVLISQNDPFQTPHISFRHYLRVISICDFGCRNTLLGGSRPRARTPFARIVASRIVASLFCFVPSHTQQPCRKSRSTP
jgi:hypothetical protein